MIRSILVPLDGSRFAEQALPTASAVARRTGAGLWLARGHVAARSCPDGIVVMAAHRRPPFERLLYGSIADALVRRSGVPVLLVGGREANAGGVERVFLPLDGSADAEAAVAPAFDVAGPVEYVLFHIDGDSGDVTTVPRRAPDLRSPIRAAHPVRDCGMPGRPFPNADRRPAPAGGPSERKARRERAGVARHPGAPRLRRPAPLPVRVSQEPRSRRLSPSSRRGQCLRSSSSRRR